MAGLAGLSFEAVFTSLRIGVELFDIEGLGEPAGGNAVRTCLGKVLR